MTSRQRIAWDLKPSDNNEVLLFDHINNLSRGEKKRVFITTIKSFYLPFALAATGASASDVKRAAIESITELESRIKLIERSFLNKKTAITTTVTPKDREREEDIENTEDKLVLRDPLHVVINW